jgi:hypothetical protein
MRESDQPREARRRHRAHGRWARGSFWLEPPPVSSDIGLSDRTSSGRDGDNVPRVLVVGDALFENETRMGASGGTEAWSCRRNAIRRALPGICVYAPHPTMRLSCGVNSLGTSFGGQSMTFEGMPSSCKSRRLVSTRRGVQSKPSAWNPRPWRAISSLPPPEAATRILELGRKKRSMVSRSQGKRPDWLCSEPLYMRLC